ncbi:alpha/beta fold hydrolase [Halorubrum lacusprofundi]|jgi:pimeloyl-ACP methyl ester carboxylesterase|uniref:Alpha/beta hydrolase fold protein n=1 Tax=Halorubrum lacusprofundi (strain ATCC 49239 / DSM 5036 / JCM 8891 / ACAM 34) TaxID=416348 RepID=B9LT49_HALLT|nr:alpha/beta hydrolase [Halorubrum lacusprofundi]ACM56114.1 alpha/beta hydrolase fold protein [Halorubrum lacusprofundi ATCC 49239]MCG1005575.1 alpha/beta fold hydrolase [Halorubrum lacusprofundi]
MKLRNLAGTALLGVGAIAALNTGLRYEGELESPLDGDDGTFRWRGMNVAYTEAGDPDDPDLVLLHGVNAAGSAGEWREVFDDLAAEHHVFAPDLPGFGRSDRPPLRYSAALYEDFVRDFLADFDEPAVVASSLSAAYAAAAVDEAGSTADGVEVRGFVGVCPTTVAGPSPPKSWLRELIRAPLVGDALFNVIASKPSIRYFNADHGYDDPTNPSDEWTDYEWRTAHVENARFAPASFVSGYLNSDLDLAAALASMDAAPTIVWGREADVSPLSDGRDLADASGARLVVFDRAKLLPHVEHPERFVETVEESLVASAAV